MKLVNLFCGIAVSAVLAASLMLTSANVASAQDVCGTTTYPLYAGQTNVVGTLTVSNDLDNVYVTYTLTATIDCGADGLKPAAEFGTLHLWVGDDLLNVPANPQGTPVPGQFPYSFDGTGLQSYTFAVPFSQLGITNATDACDALLYVVAHAEVNYLDCNGDLTGGGDTAFGGDHDVNVGTPGRWWWYGEYFVCCDFGPPPVPFCETAFAKGTHVWTTQKKSNPDNLPSLKLTQNRWGWAINLKAPGTTQYDIYAGAGLNNTSKGTLVGTLTVSWDGTDVCFLYEMNDGFAMQELHFYADDSSPTTLAPGQYGYTADFNDGPVTEWSDCVAASDNNGGGVWVIAHAVVCLDLKPRP